MVDTADDMACATEEWGWDLYIPSPGGGDGGGSNSGYRNLRRQLPEHCHTIYCDKNNYGPVSSGDEAFWGASSEAVMILVEGKGMRVRVVEDTEGELK